MLYYEKNLSAPKPTPRAAFDQLWRFLDFRELVNYVENRRELAEWREHFKPGAPDLAAAVMAHLAYRNWLDKEIIAEQALRYCRTMLEDAGFEETALYEIKSQLDSEENHVILVFGCQGHKVRDYRASAAFHVLKKLANVPLKVVFSGHHPAEPGSTKTVRTNDEARALEREFSRLVDQDPDVANRHNFTVSLENQSTSTRQNLENFFNGDYLREQKATLFLVSSTFHLPRLARDAEQLIGADSNIKSMVQRLYLVGSETHPSEDPVTLEAIYIKAMLFEVFHHLFQYAPFAIERPGAYEGAV
jgi:hypothetical protein